VSDDFREVSPYPEAVKESKIGQEPQRNPSSRWLGRLAKRPPDFPTQRLDTLYSTTQVSPLFSSFSRLPGPIRLMES
jgi:hypothetical protein